MIDGRLVIAGDHRFLAGVELGRPADTQGAVEAAATAGFRLLRVRPDQPLDEIATMARPLGLLVCSDLPARLPHAFRPGWATGDERDLPALLRRRQRRARFPVGSGAPSVAGSPAGLAHLVERGWPDLPTVGADDIECFAHHTPPGAFDDVADWARATRNYQAMVVRFAIETFRRNAMSGTLGFVLDRLADGPDEIVGPGLLDHEGTPKEAFTAATAACRPLLAVADRLPPHLHGDEDLSIDVHLLDDRSDAPGTGRVAVDATARWADGERRWRLEAADRAPITHLGTVRLSVPAVTGPLTLDVTVEADGPPVTSSYRSDIFADPHDH